MDVNLKTMIALVDTKVSIGTFVQLIRHQTFGLLGSSSPIWLDRAREHRIQSAELINAFCIKIAAAIRYW
ncbi:MAG: hypothetical protein ABSG53_18975, partial [Thermoguttaceae bacterium]